MIFDVGFCHDGLPHVDPGCERTVFDVNLPLTRKASSKNIPRRASLHFILKKFHSMKGGQWARGPQRGRSLIRSSGWRDSMMRMQG